MAFKDGNWEWGIPAHADAGAVNSTNTTDVGADAQNQKPFAGEGAEFQWQASLDANVDSFQIDIVGSDAAALNSGNVILASTGAIATDENGDALGTAAHVIKGVLRVKGQTVAKRHYGAITTTVGSGSTVTADAKGLGLVEHGQTNMPNPS